MTNLAETINSIKDDMANNIDKDLFLAICVKTRIESYSHSYDTHFDRLLKMMELKEYNEHDLIELSRSLRQYSNMTCTLYASLSRNIQLFNEKLINT